MAKATLPTNFKDDILASSMGSKRRYNVINNSDGTISLEDVTTYTQVGSTFGAAQINATNKAANAAADASKIIDDYDTLMANTQAGYMAGALAVKELNSDLSGKVSASGNVYAEAYAVFDVSDFKKVTYTINANNGNASGGNALVVDGTIKAYTKAFNESTLTSSGTLDITSATTLEIRTYANASTLNNGWGGTYTLEFS